MTDQSLPPTVSERDFSSVLSLIALLADPAAAKARIAALREYQVLLEKVSDTLQESRAEHEKSKYALRSAEIASEKQIAAAREKHEAECSARETALKAREKELAAATENVAATREAVAKLRADLDRRLAALRDAALT